MGLPGAYLHTGRAEHDVRAHADEVVDEVEAAFEHLLEEECRPARLRGQNDEDAHEVRRECRPDAVLDLRYGFAEIVLGGEFLSAGKVKDVAFDFPFNTKLGELPFEN